MTTKITRTALTILKNERATLIHNIEAYERDCEEDRKQGFRPHYCLHGTNQWTDYDNICGGCEDGLFSLADFMPGLYYKAISSAKAFWADMDKLKEAYNLICLLNIDDSFDFNKAFDALMIRHGVATRDGQNY